MRRMALIGFGYWGPKVAATVQRSPSWELAAVVDEDREARVQVKTLYPEVEVLESMDSLQDMEVDAVFIATPPASHIEVARTAMERSSVVVLAKPLGLELDESARFISEASVRQTVLAVDLTYLFTPAVRAIRDLIRQGSLGRVRHISSVRSNLGIFQRDCSVIWDLAVHDFAILQFALDERPSHVVAWSSRHSLASMDSSATLILRYPSGFLANIDVSWESAIKVRRMNVFGEFGTLEFDDSVPDDKLRITRASVTIEPSNLDRLAREAREVSYSVGETEVVPLIESDALGLELEELARALDGGEAVVDTVGLSLDGIAVAEAAESSLVAGGREIEVEYIR